MAVKKNRAGAIRGARKVPFEAERLRTVAQRLRTQAKKMSRHATAMQANGLEEMKIDGHKMLTRALKQIDRFLRNTQRDLDEILDGEA